MGREQGAGGPWSPLDPRTAPSVSFPRLHFPNHQQLRGSPLIIIRLSDPLNNDTRVDNTRTAARYSPGSNQEASAATRCCSSRCATRRRSSASFCPTANSPDWIPAWYTRSNESTSSIDCVLTSASSLIFAVASLIWDKIFEGYL